MYRPGLKGITAVTTSISHIDGAKGHLEYRGKPVSMLVENHTFEEICSWLIANKLEKPEELKGRELPDHIMETIERMKDHQSIPSIIRTCGSMLDDGYDHWPYQAETAFRLIAALPVIVAYTYRRKHQLPIIKPDPSLDHVSNFLYMLFGEKKEERETKALEAYMILSAEHGLNASTFAARVVTSTKSDVYSGLTAAIGALKGPLHGGAPSGVLTYFEEVQHSSVKDVVRKCVEKNERIMGFGHRVYKTTDPRAEALKSYLLQMESRPKWLNEMIEIENETVYWLNKWKPGRQLYANVEFYAAAIMKSIGIKPELFTPIFTCSRSPGWLAHMIEQSNDNVIFRPESQYQQ